VWDEGEARSAVGHVADRRGWDAAQSAASDGRLLIVAFSASWCAPCQAAAPAFEALAAATGSATFLKVDVDEAEEVTAECGVLSMPTYHAYRHGERVGQQVGGDVATLAALVAELSATA